jgi:hypothetical protein
MSDTNGKRMSDIPTNNSTADPCFNAEKAIMVGWLTLVSYSGSKVSFPDPEGRRSE